MIQIKRVYEQPSEDDGRRYLVERLWPRGVSRESARLDGWLKDLAPSPALRRWFGHDPGRWDGFREGYEAELRAPGARPVLRELAEEAMRCKITFVFAARDVRRNSAVALKELLEAHYL